MAKTIDLTGALKSKKASQVAAQPTVTGCETDVDGMMRAKRTMDNAKLLFDSARSKLETLASALRVNLENKGIFHTKVTLQGTCAAIGLTFGDRLSAMTEDAAAQLASMVGPAFDNLFVRVVGWKFRDGVDLGEFHRVLAAHGIDPSTYFEPKADVRPVEDFRRVRFELRQEMTRDQNRVLDAAIEQLQYTPTMSGVTKWVDPESAAS